MSDYETGYRNGEQNILADVDAAFDEVLGLKVDGAWDAARKVAPLARIGAAVLERVDGEGFTGGSGVWVCPACGVYKPQIESDEGHHNDCPITEALDE